MTRLLIIADDFTGALDTGVQMGKRGIDTLVAVLRDGQVDLDSPCQVLVVNTESRHILASEAYARTAALVRVAPAAGFTHIYKKTDSTMRGNIGAELAALMENFDPAGWAQAGAAPAEPQRPGAVPENGRQAGAAPAEPQRTHANELVFVPAFPKLGRFTIDGLQYVNKELLSETAFANDPFNPIRQSGVREIIAGQTAASVENVYLGEFDKLRQTAGADALPVAGIIRIVDARTDDDLQAIGRILKEAGKLRVLAGCAGFAELLPELLDLPTAPVATKRRPGGTLLVSGSVNPQSISQVRYALENCGYASSRLTVAQKIDADFQDPAWEEQLLKQLAGAGKAAIWSQRAETAADDALEQAQALGLDTSHLGSLIAANIGAIVRRALDHASVGTLVVFGGDTLLGIADAIGCHLVRPAAEIVPGVALGQFVGTHYQMNVVTKAGGFGGEDVAGQIEAWLSGLEAG